MSGALTKAKIEQLAPDQASLGAALKLVKPARWPALATDGAALVWGECQGSGSTPYRTVVAMSDLGYKCTCPSRKFPCKHVLALMWLHCEDPQRFAEGAPPPWVADWLGRRRGGGKPAPAEGGGPARGGSIAAALAGESPQAAPDPKAAARAEAQRQRLRQEREASVLEGVASLERWIGDQLHHGLAGFAADAARNCRAMAARLVDAKAPGLASLLDQLAADLFRVRESQRADLALERLAALTLLAAACRRQDALPPPLRADARRAVGWTMRREELLAGAEALRVAALWLVIATRSEVQPDRLLRQETWLMRLEPAAESGGAVDLHTSSEAAPRFALLLDYVPVGAGAAAPYAAGEAMKAELAFYPSAAPLRAQIADSGPATREAGEAAPWPAFPDGVDAALAGYERALAAQPWLEAWPVAASGLRAARGEGGALAIADGCGAALPLTPSQWEAAAPLQGLPPFAATGLWDGRALTLFAADTPLGLWRES